VHGLARLIAIAVAVAVVAAAACGDRTDAPRATGDAAGLVRLLEARRHSAVVPACVPRMAEYDQIVTRAYRGVGGASPDVLRRAVLREGDVTVHVLYADDAKIPPALRRARPVVPVGKPPLVAFIGGEPLPALWVFHHGHWRCLVDMDGVVVSRIADPACRAAYAGASEGRCLDLTAPLAAAVLGGVEAERARLCALIVAHGCGSVPAGPSPTTTP
jgi:hypothetical protein